MGGQNDENDFHSCIFDTDSLTMILEASGLVDIKPWESDIQDCAGLPISLNLMGRKPDPSETKAIGRKISAIMSMPRLTFTDTMTCIFRHIVAKGIPFNRSSGVFWGQCLTMSPHPWG